MKKIREKIKREKICEGLWKKSVHAIEKTREEGERNDTGRRKRRGKEKELEKTKRKKEKKEEN